jgi:hypothetical protein
MPLFISRHIFIPDDARYLSCFNPLCDSCANALCLWLVLECSLACGWWLVVWVAAWYGRCNKASAAVCVLRYCSSALFCASRACIHVSVACSSQ